MERTARPGERGAPGIGDSVAVQTGGGISAASRSPIALAGILYGSSREFAHKWSKLGQCS